MRVRLNILYDIVYHIMFYYFTFLKYYSVFNITMSDSPSSPSSQSSVSSPLVRQERMVELAKIYQKDGTVYKEWDGKEPGNSTFICVFGVVLDGEWIKRTVFSNCGDGIKREIKSSDIQGEPLSFKIQDSSSYPTTIGTYLKLSNSSSTLGQPRILDECWHRVTFLLQKLMREGKIFKFDPRSGITTVSYGHKDVTEPDNYSFWLDLSGIPYRDAHNASTTFFNRDIFTEPTRSIPVSEFENPSLYIPFYEYIPRHITGRALVKETGSTSLGEAGRSHKRPKLSGGKSRRRVKRRFKRKTIKRINKRNKRKTIKRRFTPLKI